MLTTTTAPLLYRRLLRSFFRTGADFFVSYFHADEIAGAVGGWRNQLYSYRNLIANIATLRRMAVARGYAIRFVTVRELGDILFADMGTDEGRTGHT
jgi:hypothetical protein